MEKRRSSNAPLSSYAYEYDQNGFITKETEMVDAATYIREYTYDAVWQLTGYVEKLNSRKDHELIYYINDVTIDNEEVIAEYGAAGTATGT